MNLYTYKTHASSPSSPGFMQNGFSLLQVGSQWVEDWEICAFKVCFSCVYERIHRLNSGSRVVFLIVCQICALSWHSFSSSSSFVPFTCNRPGIFQDFANELLNSERTKNETHTNSMVFLFFAWKSMSSSLTSTNFFPRAFCQTFRWIHNLFDFDGIERMFLRSHLSRIPGDKMLHNYSSCAIRSVTALVHAFSPLNGISIEINFTK